MGITVVLRVLSNRPRGKQQAVGSAAMNSNLRKSLIVFGVAFSLACERLQLATMLQERCRRRKVHLLSRHPHKPHAKKRGFRKPDVIYYPTPPETVNEMLRLANIKEGEVLYDLGSGDGRIPIAAGNSLAFEL